MSVPETGPLTALQPELLLELLLVALGVALLIRRIKLPYTIALVLAGLALGAIEVLPHGRILTPDLIFLVFLPPLLFEAAIHLPLRILSTVWKPVAFMATIGVAIATVLTGYAVAWVAVIPLTAGLLFGVMVAATDPVSVIALLKEMRVNRRLSVLIEAESLFNDGFAAALYHVLLAIALGTAQFSLTHLGYDLGKEVLGGVLVGLAIGYAVSAIMERIDDHLLEITLTTIAAWGSFALSDRLHVSGVMAVIAAGVVIGRSEMHSMSPTTRAAVRSFWDYITFLVNSLLFVMIGLEVTIPKLVGHWRAILLGFLVLVLARGISVLIAGLVAGRSRRERVPASWQGLLVWGGLRGSLGMALVLAIPPEFALREQLVHMTFGVVVVSLLLQGLTVGPLVKALGLSVGRSVSQEYGRLTAMLIGKRMASEELDRLAHQGAISPALAATLNEETRTDMDRIEARIEQLHLEDEELSAEQRHQAVTRMLYAERLGVDEAMRSGILSEEAAKEMRDALETRLEELEIAHTESATDE